MTTLTIRIDPAVKDRLSAIAQHQGRSLSNLAQQALHARSRATPGGREQMLSYLDLQASVPGMRSNDFCLGIIYALHHMGDISAEEARDLRAKFGGKE